MEQTEIDWWEHFTEWEGVGESDEENFIRIYRPEDPTPEPIPEGMIGLRFTMGLGHFSIMEEYINSTLCMRRLPNIDPSLGRPISRTELITEWMQATEKPATKELPEFISRKMSGFRWDFYDDGPMDRGMTYRESLDFWREGTNLNRGVIVLLREGVWNRFRKMCEANKTSVNENINLLILARCGTVNSLKDYYTKVSGQQSLL